MDEIKWHDGNFASRTESAKGLTFLNQDERDGHPGLILFFVLRYYNSVIHSTLYYYYKTEIYNLKVYISVFHKTTGQIYLPFFPVLRQSRYFSLLLKPLFRMVNEWCNLFVSYLRVAFKGREGGCVEWNEVGKRRIVLEYRK